MSRATRCVGAPGIGIGVVSLLLASACQDGQYRILVHVPGGVARAERVDVAVLRSCGEVSSPGAAPGDPLRVVDAAAEEPSPIGKIHAGTYGLYGRAWTAGCVLFAAGCDTVQLEGGGEGTLHVYLGAIAEQGCGPRERCEVGSCVAVDGGLDAGADGGVDGGADAGADGEDAGADGGHVEPCDPAAVGSLDLVSEAQGVAVSGPTAFVAANGRVYLVDVSDPAAPELASEVDAGNAHRVATSGWIAFVANGDGASGLKVIDGSNPASPSVLADLDTFGNAMGIALSGDFALLADETEGVHVVDVRAPADPQFLGSVDTPQTAWDVAVSFPYAFIADGNGGLQIADLSEKVAPVLVQSIEGIGLVESVALWDDFAFVAVWADGLKIADVSDLEAPALVGSIETPGDALDVEVQEGYAFVADGASGLQILDVSNPELPAQAGSVDTPGVAKNVAVSGPNAFVADGAAGLQVVEHGCPQRDFPF